MKEPNSYVEEAGPHDTDHGGIIQTRYEWYNINTYSLPAKFTYFFEAARRISYSPNLVLFLTGIGLNKEEAGQILGFRMIGMLIGGPFWGMIADKWKCHRIVIVIMCFTSLLTMCIQPLITIKYGDPNINKCPYTKTNYEFPSNCTNCSSQENCSIYSNMTSPTTSGDMMRDNSSLFSIMLFMYIAVAFCEGSAIAMVDTGTIRRVELSTHREIDFGAQKFLAALGGTFGITITNVIIDHFPEASVTCYSGIFITYPVFSILFTISILFLYRGLLFESAQELQTGVTDRKHLMKTFYKNICQIDVAFFYLSALVTGIIYSPYTSFMFLYLKDLDSPPMLFTLSIAMAGAASIFGFFFSVKIIEKLGGTWNALAMTFLMYAIRYLGNSLLVNSWLVLLTQPLHALCYCVFLTAGVIYLKETVPVSIITTMVSIFNSLHFGVGPLIGSNLCGIVYQKYGGRVLFRASATLAFAWFFTSVVLYILLQTKN